MSETAAEAAVPDIVTDAVLDGRLLLRQPRRGHRAGTDAVLLAAAASVEPGDLLVDVGAGVGTVGLALALREPRATGILLDDDPGAAALAEENCRLNRVADRVKVVTADLFDAAARRSAELFEEQADLVVTNPPYFLNSESRRAGRSAKSHAYVLGRGVGRRSHGDWLCACLSLLKPRGRLYAIHRPAALPDLLAACRGRLGALVLVPVHPSRARPAIRILLSGLKGSRAAMRIGSPLVLHEPDGRFTPEAEAIHRGEAVLPM